MLKEQFAGHNPSHFHINEVVKAYIIAESFVWAAWNFVTPIFAVFVINSIEAGSVQLAGMAFSTYLISRVVFELISGKLLIHSSDNKKYIFTIIGIAFISLAYLGFAFAKTLPMLFLFYAVAGVGLGIASPAKNALFSMHLDKNKESSEWGIADAMTFIAMALAATIGGFVAEQYGFTWLFFIAFVVNLLGTVPYLLQLR